MKLLELKMSNFFSFGNKEEVLNLSNPGLYLVLGENGTGKSAIIDAIVFALFGKVVKDVNLPEITNEQTNSNTKVELKFEIGGSIYWIIRYRKHIKYKNEVHVFKNERTSEGLISFADIDDTQEKINQLIRVNYKTFINAITMTQENVIGFLEAESSKRKEIIESILQLDLFIKYHYIAQEKRKIFKRKYELIESDINGLKKVITGSETSMKQYTESSNKLKKENQQKITELENELKDLDHIDIEKELQLIKFAQEMSLKFEQQKSVIKHLDEQINGINEQKKNILNTQTEYKNFISASQKTIKRMNNNYTTELTNLKKMDEEIKNVEKNPDKCPTCNNIINIEELNLWIGNQKKELKTRSEKICLDKKQIEKEEIQIIEWDKKNNELSSQLELLNSQINELDNQIKQINNDCEKIEIPKTKKEKDLRDLSDKKQKIITQIDVLKNKQFIDYNYLNTQLEQHKEHKKQLREKEDELKSINKQILIYSFWENSFSSKRSSMKSWCINNIIGFFNAKIKYYIDRFFDGDVEVQLDNELTEKLSFKNSDRSFGTFSGGQKRRLNLAILFALNSLVKANATTKISIMFLDEILSNFLDDKGISTVLELLEEMKENGETVYIIDHRDNFKNYPLFQRIDVFKDKNDFSHIVVNQ